MGGGHLSKAARLRLLLPRFVLSAPPLPLAIPAASSLGTGHLAQTLFDGGVKARDVLGLVFESMEHRHGNE